jgi:predicted AAA+ superfamily ATPase
LIEKIAENITNPFSINKIYNQFKSLGYKLDKNILYEINTYVENIYLAFSVSKFDYSIKKRAASYKKVYFIDNGLLNSLITGYSNNYGKLLENAVYLYLRQIYSHNYEQSVFYYKNTKECDFILYSNKEVKAAIQVSHSIEEKNTFSRELAGLKQAMETYKLKKGYIITSEQEYTISENDFTIEVLAAYKLLSQKSYTFS